MEGEVNMHFQSSYAGDKEIQVVAFKLGQEEYAVDIVNVMEINRLTNITRVPKTASYIEGVINLRGNIIPLINLNIRFSIEASGVEDDKRIIVFQFDDIKAGIIVDEVSEVLRLSEKDIEQVDKVYNAVNSEQITGIAKINDRLLILLDIKKIFESENFRQVV